MCLYSRDIFGHMSNCLNSLVHPGKASRRISSVGIVRRKPMEMRLGFQYSASPPMSSLISFFFFFSLSPSQKHKTHRQTRTNTTNKSQSVCSLVTTNSNKPTPFFLKFTFIFFPLTTVSHHSPSPHLYVFRPSLVHCSLHLTPLSSF